VRSRAYKGETRIYVESFFRCEEMVRLRKYLLVRAAEVVSSTRSLDRLEAVLYDRPAGRNIVEHAVETIERLRAELHALKPELVRDRVAALKAHDPLNDAVEEACGELPDQWQVVVYLERSAGWVELVHPNFHQEDVHEDETSIADLVREAVRRAKEGGDE
jgi:hypothetical protein